MNISSMKIIDSEQKIQKRKRISKKNKKAWRKHTKVQDVEDFLEDQRLEERLGKKSVLGDDLLFKEDKTGIQLASDEDQIDTDDTGFEDDDDDKEFESKKGKIQISRKEWRQQLLNKPIKSYKILEPDTQVPDPIAKRNRVRPQEERQHVMTRLKEISRLENGILKKKEKEAILTRKVNKERKERKPIKGQVTKDIWNEREPSFLDQLGDDKQWLNDKTIFHFKKNTGLYTKKKEDEKKPYIIKAIEPPHPGMSYNPSFKDHQQLLAQVTEDEMKLIKEEEHLTRVTTKMFHKISPQTQQKEWMEEMSQGLSTDPVSNDNEKLEPDDGILKSVNPPAKNKKKNLQKRRRLKEQRKRELEKRREKIEKKKIADLYKIKHIKQDFEKVDQKVALLQEKREKIKQYKTKEAKQLSKYKFKPMDLDFTMPDELKGSLRLVKQEGDLLKERFNSLEKRNIIETRVKQRKIKPKTKKYVKKSHRDPEEATNKKSKITKKNYFSKK